MLYMVDTEQNRISPWAPKPVSFAEVASEGDLRNWVKQAPILLGGSIKIVGEGVQIKETPKLLDLLAVNEAGELVVISLQGQDPPEAVTFAAQMFAAACAKMDLPAVTGILQQYREKNPGPEGLSPEDELTEWVSKGENFNSSQRIILITCQVDERTQTVAEWLRSQHVHINLINFNFFQSGGMILFEPTMLIPASEEEGGAASAAGFPVSPATGKTKPSAAIQEEVEEKEPEAEEETTSDISDKDRTLIRYVEEINKNMGRNRPPLIADPKPKSQKHRRVLKCWRESEFLPNDQCYFTLSLDPTGKKSPEDEMQFQLRVNQSLFSNDEKSEQFGQNLLRCATRLRKADAYKQNQWFVFEQVFNIGTGWIDLRRIRKVVNNLSNTFHLLIPEVENIEASLAK